MRGLSPSRYPEAAITLWRTFGARGFGQRAIHEVRRIMGWYRGSPTVQVDAEVGRPLFAVDGKAIVGATTHDKALDRGNRVVDGQHHAFRGLWRELPDSPDDWAADPETGAPYPRRVPWYRISTIDPSRGDIKDLWEPGRFGWAYDLVRAHLLTDDARYAHAFHAILTDWYGANPPFHGPHWVCGQETSIRAIALLYAEAAFTDDERAAPDALQRLVNTLLWSGERINDAIGYGLSQRNNHGISEATGLVALGARFQGSAPPARGWLDRGHVLVERCLLEQFSRDGWYAQHSFTYMRVALDMSVVAQRALRSVGRTLAPEVVGRVRAAYDLLCLLIDTDTGIVPNFGSNDGALVHPITLADYRDFRPLLTSLAATFDFPLPESIEADGEVLAWLDRPPPDRVADPPDGVVRGSSGWAVARVGSARVFMRAGKLKHRPGQLDQLQLDIRIGGCEVVVDPGSYAYNAPPPWANGLAGARVHNGPILDRQEPGVRGPRFLWYIWPAAAILSTHWDGATATIVADREGEVRREVRVTADSVEVVDSVAAGRHGTLEVGWLLHPGTDPSLLEVDGDVTIHEVSEDDTRGWFSPTYGLRQRGVFVMVVRSDGEALTTRIRDRGTSAADGEQLMLTNEGPLK